MKNPKITKQWLFDRCCGSYHDLIEKHFPKTRNTTTISAFIRRTRKLGISNADIDHVVYIAVPDGWEEIEAATKGMATEDESREMHNFYLKEFKKPSPKLKESDMEVKKVVEYLKNIKIAKQTLYVRTVIFSDGSGSVERRDMYGEWDDLFVFSSLKQLAKKLERYEKALDYKSLFSVVGGYLKADFSKIKITEENVLPLSIAKWEVICENLENGRHIADFGRDTCACCKLYDEEPRCAGCPIGTGCVDSPYADYIAAHTLCEAMKAAHAEVEFLKSLMEK